MAIYLYLGTDTPPTLADMETFAMIRRTLAPGDPEVPLRDIIRHDDTLRLSISWGPIVTAMAMHEACKGPTPHAESATDDLAPLPRRRQLRSDQVKREHEDPDVGMHSEYG